MRQNRAAREQGERVVLLPESLPFLVGVLEAAIVFKRDGSQQG